ncbi:MAG TPA: hypothetical protein VMH90_07240, partial [Thermoplasmata archaeon]|nr:hypothetical protein [Thermoplasmata archaeon]
GSDGSGLTSPWQNASCSNSTSGTEYVWGGLPYGPYYNATNLPLFVGFSGPYLPGPAFGAVIPGSDLFQGAARNWPPIEGYGGVYGYGGLGVPGPVVIGGPSGIAMPSPPPPPPVPSGFPLVQSPPLDPAHSGSAPGPMPGLGTIALVGGAALAGAAATALFLWRRRGVVPPPGPSR